MEQTILPVTALASTVYSVKSKTFHIRQLGELFMNVCLRGLSIVYHTEIAYRLSHPSINGASIYSNYIVGYPPLHYSAMLRYVWSVGIKYCGCRRWSNYDSHVA